MKKVFSIMFFLAMACSQNDDSFSIERNWKNTYQGICGPTPDAVRYPEPWTKEVMETFIIPAETIRTMSSCGLLETCLANPDCLMGPWNTISSDLNFPGISAFNSTVRNNKVVAELLKRNDCFTVLTAKYQFIIEQKTEKSGKEQYFEMFLASDACMSVLSNEERIQFMNMALEMIERDKTLIIETRHILVAVMKSFNYMPFLVEAEKNQYAVFSFADKSRNGFSEWLKGYDICSYDVVEKYAKRFLNELK